MSEQKQSAGSQSFLRWFRAVILVLVVGTLGYHVYQNTTGAATHPFKLGLDLAGGSHLVYQADVSGVDSQEVPELMSVLRDVIERRVNLFGVSEPIVQVEQSSFVTNEPIERLVVELPGVTDVSQAVAEIGRTPLLEFKLFDETLAAQAAAAEEAIASLVASTSGSVGTSTAGATITAEEIVPFRDTGLTGRYLKNAEAMLPQNQQGAGFTSSSFINIHFNSEGAKLFEDITRANVGVPLGIFLDGELLSAPVINEAIAGGTAMITGSFTPDEAKSLAQNLSFGALPVPIELQSTQTIGSTLGADVLGRGVTAGVVGLLGIMAFMVLWYRLPGVVASVALLSYVVIMLALFQYIPVTLTAAGLAGFIISLGMAVDANVLVFERMKEEYAAGKDSRTAAREGFARAWSAIRDGNITSLLSAIILFWFGTSMVQGFALVFGLGVIVSMLSALLITRTLLLVLPCITRTARGGWSLLYGSGFKR